MSNLDHLQNIEAAGAGDGRDGQAGAWEGGLGDVRLK